MNHLTGNGTPVRFDVIMSDMLVYKDHVLIKATNVNITLAQPGDSEVIHDMAGNVMHIGAAIPKYSISIDNHAWLNPLVFMWADVEAYLASQQYQIQEMELP